MIRRVCARALYALFLAVLLLISQGGAFARHNVDFSAADDVGIMGSIKGVLSDHVFADLGHVPRLIDETCLVMLCRPAKNIINASNYVELQREVPIIFFFEEFGRLLARESYVICDFIEKIAGKQEMPARGIIERDGTKIFTYFSLGRFGKGMFIGQSVAINKESSIECGGFSSVGDPKMGQKNNCGERPFGAWPTCHEIAGENLNSYPWSLIVSHHQQLTLHCVQLLFENDGGDDSYSDQPKSKKPNVPGPTSHRLLVGFVIFLMATFASVVAAFKGAEYADDRGSPWWPLPFLAFLIVAFWCASHAINCLSDT
jgi:hypothetical protein